MTSSLAKVAIALPALVAFALPAFSQTGTARAGPTASPVPSPSAPQVRPSPMPSENRIEAEAVNLRNSNGSLRCALFGSRDGFPNDSKAAVASTAVRIENRRAACVFPNLPPGSYALAVLHDENDNDRMDYNFMGLPVEGYAFSNDARGILGPPTFDAAKFIYTGGALTVPIGLRY